MADRIIQPRDHPDGASLLRTTARLLRRVRKETAAIRPLTCRVPGEVIATPETTTLFWLPEEQELYQRIALSQA